MKKIRFLSYYFFLFVLCLSFLFLSLILTLNLTLLNEEFIKNKLKEDNYIQKTYDSIYVEMNHYLIQSGLPEEVLKDIVTEEKVEKDILSNLASLYESKNFEIVTDDITLHLENNINQYLEKQNIVVKDEESLNLFVQQMSHIYKEELTLYGTLPKIKKAVPTIKKGFTIIFYFSLGLFITSLLVIKFFLKKKIGSILFFVNGLLLCLTKTYIYQHVDIANLLIVDVNFSSLLKNVLTTYFEAIGLEGFCFLGLGFLYLLIRNMGYILKR